MNKKSLWIIGVIIVVLILGFVAINNKSGDGDTIKIGYIGPLTGDVAILGIEASNSIKLAINNINEQGGINGKQVELIIEDDQYDTAQTVSAYEKLVNQNNVETVIISTYGGVFAVAERAEQDNVLVVDPLDCDQDIADLPDNVFCIAKETKDLADVIADYSIDQGYSNIGILHSTTDNFMPSVALMFEQRIGNNADVQIEKYTSGTTDFKTSLLKLKEKDALVFLGYDEIGIAIKQASDLGLDQPRLTIPSVATTPSIQEASQKTIDGIYFSFYAPPEENAKATKFYNDYESEYGRPPIVYVATDHAYDSINILLTEILPGAENIEDKIEKMHQVSDYEGVSGKLTMGSDGRINGILIRLYKLEGLAPVYIQG